MNTTAHDTPWSVSDTKSHLSEILRRARKSGPQYIGKREQCVLVSKKERETHVKPKVSLATWLLTHSPKTELEVQERGQSTSRPNPFGETDA